MSPDELVALATPLQASDATYSLNESVSTSDRMEAVVDALAEPLLKLRREVLDAMDLRGEE
jgi:hypothetical protein